MALDPALVGRVVLSQPLGGHQRVQRPGEVPALSPVAAKQPQRGGRRRGFHALSYGADPKRGGEPDQRLDRNAVVLGVRQRADEGRIDLYLADAEPGELRERGVAGTEVV